MTADRVCHKGWSWRLFRILYCAGEGYVGWASFKLLVRDVWAWLRGAEWTRS